MSTIREQLIEADKAILETATVLKKVKRTVPSYEDLKRYSSIQLPIAAVTAGLPKPKLYHESKRAAGMIDHVTSELVVEANVYFQQANDELIDSDISSLSNTLFVLLFEDQTRGNLCQRTEVGLHPKAGYWRPYGAFKILIKHYYIHTTGGI